MSSANTVQRSQADLSGGKSASQTDPLYCPVSHTLSW